MTSASPEAERGAKTGSLQPQRDYFVSATLSSGLWSVRARSCCWSHRCTHRDLTLIHTYRREEARRTDRQTDDGQQVLQPLGNRNIFLIYFMCTGTFKFFLLKIHKINTPEVHISAQVEKFPREHTCLPPPFKQCVTGVPRKAFLLCPRHCICHHDKSSGSIDYFTKTNASRHMVLC